MVIIMVKVITIGLFFVNAIIPMFKVMAQNSVRYLLPEMLK